MILAFESSCDETAVAIFDARVGIVGEWVHSQIALHAEHGGVVPDIATREHLRNFAPLLSQAAGHPGWPEVDRVAVTHGPGLAACLALGVAAANAVAHARRLPIVGVNHLRAHAWSPFIGAHARSPARFLTELDTCLPHLGLIVSGGNTILLEISADRAIRQISATRDDAAGEALDKGAKLLGLGYPGGPAVERLAREGRRDAFDFPRGMGSRETLDFSFSGLKTSLRYRIQGMEVVQVHARMADLCASYQEAVVDALARRTSEALESGSFRSVGLSGGVANNVRLRGALAEVARASGRRLLAAEPQHTGDNAAMIAFSAWLEGGALGAPSGPVRPNPAAHL